MGDKDALYIISVAAKLVELHPSTLRKYERVGLLEPSRPGGKLRLYSTDDIRRLRQIKRLAEEKGINLAGIELALKTTEGLLRARVLLTESSAERPTARDEQLSIIDELLQSLGFSPEAAS